MHMIGAAKAGNPAEKRALARMGSHYLSRLLCLRVTRASQVGAEVPQRQKTLVLEGACRQG